VNDNVLCHSLLGSGKPATDFGGLPELAVTAIVGAAEFAVRPQRDPDYP
jgi:hypothetical protein